MGVFGPPAKWGARRQRGPLPRRRRSGAWVGGLVEEGGDGDGERAGLLLEQGFVAREQGLEMVGVDKGLVEEGGGQDGGDWGWRREEAMVAGQGEGWREGKAESESGFG